MFESYAQSKQTVKFITAEEVKEGDGAMVRRLIPIKGLKHYDPYVLFDDFTITPPNGFPDHFHSGFEVVTYLKQGQLQHKDSRGNDVILRAGDLQCFATGSGVVHSEMPVGTEQVRGFQIWINLPKVDKHIKPGHEVIRAAAVPTTKIDEYVSIKTVVGQGATVHTRAELLIQQYNILAKGLYKLVLPVHYQGMVYVVKGSIMIEGKICNAGVAVLFMMEDLEVKAMDDAEFLLLSGLPLGEPIRRRGSVVK